VDKSKGCLWSKGFTLFMQETSFNTFGAKFKIVVCKKNRINIFMKRKEINIGKIDTPRYLYGKTFLYGKL